MAILDALTVSDTGIKDGKSLTDIAKSIADFGGNVWKDMTLLEKTALAASPIPFAGDIAGLAADAEMYATKPEERNILNYAMTMAGIVPGIPAASMLRRAGKPIMPADRVEGNIATTEDLMLAQRLLNTGFLAIENAGKPAEIKKAMNRYNKAMQNDAFRGRETQAAANDFVTIFTPDQLPDARQANPEDMVGSLAMPIKTDQSNLGTLEYIGGLPVNTRVQAGKKFSRQNQGSGVGWMSMFDTAENVVGKVNTGLDQPGVDRVLGINTSMGREATNFSTAIAEPIMRQIKNLDIPNADKAEFDAELRKIFPSWVGLDSPDAMDQLMGRGDFKNVGKNRTKFVETMGKVKYRNKGFPNVSELYDATIDPDYVGQPIRATGGNVIDLLGGQANLNTDRHFSYTGEVPAEYFGDMSMVPFEIMFPKTFAAADRVIQTKRGPRSLNYVEKANVVSDSKNIFENLDQQWLDGVMGYLEKVGQ